MSIVAENLRRAVHSRAGGACEYCLIPESAGFYTHEIDHVVALKHGGKSELGNLALACLSCNRHKGSDLASIDPLTNEIADLFNPRGHRWSQHFTLFEARIQPKTAIGRTTARLLHFNEPLRVAERRLLVRANVLRPPKSLPS